MRIDPQAPWLRSIGDAFLASVMEEALRRDPDDEEALAYLAHAFTRSGRVAEGLGLDRRIVSLRPGDPVARYNLACSLALSGEGEAALHELEAAVALGWSDGAHARVDPDLESLREDPRFEGLLEGL